MEAAGWVNLSDDELLEKKISSLGLKLEGTELQPLVQRLYDELLLHDLRFAPRQYQWLHPLQKSDASHRQALGPTSCPLHLVSGDGIVQRCRQIPLHRLDVGCPEAPAQLLQVQ